MLQIPNSNSGIRATSFHMLNFDIYDFEKISKLIFSRYMRCMDGFFKLKF